MAVPAIQPAFTFGEVTPGLYGRFDLARMHTAAATMRNCFVSYRGGAYSRAGTKFVGFSKQTGRAYPPRLIPFKFNVNQGLALEFGNFYMRVVSDGAFVTDAPFSIAGATQADPCVVSVVASGVTAATPVNTGVTQSYAPGDDITIAGGSGADPAVLAVTTTALVSVQSNSRGTAYAGGDTIDLTGGTQSTPVLLTVSTTRVLSATIAAAGSGAPAGAFIVTGTTGVGTRFQATVSNSGSPGGGITVVNGIAIAGSYTTNPTVPSAEPVTGSGLTGCELDIVIGIDTFVITNPGVFTANAAGGTFTQASTSGSGTGATFLGAVFAPAAVTVPNGGVYAALPPNPVHQASTTGTGIGAEFNLTGGTVPGVPLSNGDWVAISGVVGMTELNGNTYVVAGISGGTLQLHDVYGNPVDSTAFSGYASGGTLARIFTLVTPYAEQDLPYLKFTQSADQMSLCCVNQMTGTEYAPQDLTRTTDSSWAFSPVVPAPSVAPPASVSGSASSSGSIDYQYVVTSVAADGTESIASPIASISSAVDISGTAGTITLTCSLVSNALYYNWYKAAPGVSVEPPIGSLFGWVGQAFGTQFIDSNIVADDTQVPPTHQDPFARGQIIGARPLTGGSGYTQAGVTYVINTTTGTGAVLTPIIVGGAVVGFIVADAGKNYGPNDSITITGDGVDATAALQVGAQGGTYPAVPAYFQERRVYANTLNNPDTYFMSQPGAFTNFDFRTPTIDSDAITGSPWSVQVDGIQWMVPMPGGLVVLTGESAWQLTGPGGSSLTPTPITPSGQDAQPQAYNGASPIVPPIRIDQSIIGVQSKGSIYRELAYQIAGNMYLGADITVNSSHLFQGHTIRENAYCEEPFKILWAVRDDGILLSDTWLKPQEVNGWARHDTNGMFQSVCSITELPVDALYLAVQRVAGTHTAYMVERMDDRIWSSVEDCWCVDCGLELPQPQPNAVLTAGSATGLGAIAGVTGLVGGQSYSAGTFAFVVDLNGQGPGTGAIPALTIVGGVITAVSFAGHEGAGYVSPALVISDPANTGSGASAVLLLNNSTLFAATAAVFLPGDVGSVIRTAGGMATVTAFVDSEHVTANITAPLQAIPNGAGRVWAQSPGSWSLTAPVSTIGGLGHLIGATVTGVADGAVIPPTVVAPDGTITLPHPATSVVVGLGFQAQLQSVYLDAGEPTVQGQRKKIAAVTVRVEASRGLKIGTNQPDGAVFSPPQIAPEWNDLVDVPDKGVAPYGSTVIPLFTGDIRVPVTGGYDTRGQVAVQQDNPLPMKVLAYISEVFAGDTPQTMAPKKQQGKAA